MFSVLWADSPPYPPHEDALGSFVGRALDIVTGIREELSRGSIRCRQIFNTIYNFPHEDADYLFSWLIGYFYLYHFKYIFHKKPLTIGRYLLLLKYVHKKKFEKAKWVITSHKSYSIIIFLAIVYMELFIYIKEN